MRTLFSFSLATLIITGMIVAPIGYHRWQDRQYRNFRVVEDGVLYRCGQLPLHRLREMVAQYGIRTVINLRDGQQLPDELEEKWVKAKMLNFVRIPYRDWKPDATGKVPADASVKEFRDVMDDPKNYPVLVHCFAGIHRTGTVCAIYRMDYQGWTNQEAMNEMRVLGYTILDDHHDVRAYLTKYRTPRDVRSVPALPASVSRTR